ncbi:MAG: hypothetical protein LAP38_12950 [Acidobacteriia bacterium]|nr:hypothetical protein [Terriglobia bacterium]
MKTRFILPLLLSVVAIAQTPGTFTATGNLNTGRFHHTGTLLPNGKVLIAGGSYSHPTIGIDAYFDVLAGAELYDPTTGRFTPAGNMTMHRSYHTATLLPNGKVLIVGGARLTTGAQPPSAELYDPITGTFTPTGDTTVARLGSHSATLLNDGTVLIAGGLQDSGTAEIYDPSTGTFHAIANTIVRHKAAIATLLSDGRVLLDGGVPYTGAEIYDPAEGTFTFAGLGIDPSESSPVAAALQTNGEVLQTLGPACADCDSRGAELFDPTTRIFTATPQTPITSGLYAGYDTATLLPDGRVLTIGGQAELFDPTSSTFTPAGPMTLFRAGHTATLLADGTVLIAGGQDVAGNAPGNTAEIYLPAALIPSPMLFSISGDGRGQGAIWHAETGQIASAGSPAVAGEALSMYTTSLADGGVIPPQIAVGGRLAEVLYCGTSSYPGYNQVNFRVPSGVAPGPAVSVRLTYIGRPSNAVTIGVQ